MANVVPPDAARVASFLAKQMKSKKGPSEHELAEAISEIELETQTKGSSFIKVHMIDPEWEIICSGLIDRNDEGLLPPIDVEFPQGSGWYWTLCAAEPSNELSQPNLVLTFEDKIVRTLKEHWGEKRAKAGYNIRAEFVRELCVEAGVKYVIPSVEGANERRNKAITVASEARQEREATNTIERLAKEAAKTREASAEGAAEGTVALTPEAQATAEAKGLKEPGLGVGSPVTVKHVAATPSQIKLLNEALAVANEKGAPVRAQMALVCALIQETSCSNPDPGNPAERGCLSLIDSTIAGIQKANGQGTINPYDIREVCAHFLTAGYWTHGGAIELARKNPGYSAGEIAQLCQGSGYPKAYAQWETEARKIVATHGGSTTSGSAAEAKSKEGEVARGTTANPAESSWDCMLRLASAVNYSVFTNGRTLFYMDGPEMAKQKPVAWVHPKPSENRLVKENNQGHKVTETGVIQVPLTATFDNTSVEYFETHKVHGRTQKRSRIAKAQSPSEIRMQLVCGFTDYAAGEVMELPEAGPLTGRWILVDVTRNCLKDKFSTILLEPPTAPIAESEEGKPAEHPTVEIPKVGSGLSNVPAPAAGQYRNPPLQGPKGLGKFQGFTVALWIIAELEYAQKQGWKGKITSGYRPGADPGTVSGGAGEHSKDQYPGGAVDFGGPTEYAQRAEFFQYVKGYTGLPLIPAQFGPYPQYPQGDGGHASGTGH